MEKLFIKNRKGQKIAVILEQPISPKGLAIVMHGLGGYKEQPHMELYARAFLEQGYISIRFDTTNTFGESDGDYSDATTTNYYEDLEDVIVWAKKQVWYREPFFLAGHSLGAFCITMFAQKHPEMVRGLIPSATVVSGQLSLDVHPKKDIDEWKEKGWQLKESSKKGMSGKLKWSHMEDRLKYDTLPLAKELKMPVLMMVGSEDTATPHKHQVILYEKIPGVKEIHVIKGAAHTFKEPKHLAEIHEIFSEWLRRVEMLKH